MKSCVRRKSQSRIFMDKMTILVEFGLSLTNNIAQCDAQFSYIDAMINHLLCHRILFSIKEQIIGADKCRCSKDAFEIVSSAAEICLRESCYHGIMFVNFKMSRMTNNLSTAPETCSFKCILSISRQ
jgi:hypothetical protein